MSKTNVNVDISLRDYFAGQALVCIMNSKFHMVAIATHVEKINLDFNKAVAVTVYALADAMIARREKE